MLKLLKTFKKRLESQKQDEILAEVEKKTEELKISYSRIAGQDIEYFNNLQQENKQLKKSAQDIEDKYKEIEKGNKKELQKLKQENENLQFKVKLLSDQYDTMNKIKQELVDTLRHENKLMQQQVLQINLDFAEMKAKFEETKRELTYCSNAKEQLVSEIEGLNEENKSDKLKILELEDSMHHSYTVISLGLSGILNLDIDVTSSPVLDLNLSK